LHFSPSQEAFFVQGSLRKDEYKAKATMRSEFFTNPTTTSLLYATIIMLTKAFVKRVNQKNFKFFSCQPSAGFLAQMQNFIRE